MAFPKIFVLLLLLLCGSEYLHGQAGIYEIVGNQNVCDNAIETYIVTGSPAPVTYQWSVTGGTLLSSSGNSANIIWTTSPGVISLGTVSCILLDAGGQQIGNPSLNVNIYAPPLVVLTTDFTSQCVIYVRENDDVFPTLNPDDCWHVCAFSTVNYFVNNSGQGAYNWFVTGAVSYNQISNTQIEVIWGAAGTGSVSVTVSNLQSCSNTITKCIKIIENPIAIITTVPDGADCRLGGTASVCLEQPLLFLGNALLGNSNSPIISWYWDFGDGTFSIEQNPSHAWTVPGVYNVTLTVTNACNCTGTCYMEVTVDPVTGVNIECATPVCANSIEDYYTHAVGCASYDWTVVNGTIISPTPYGQSIQVQWNNGSNGNGYICLDGAGCADYCPAITCIEVPIVATTTSISGPSVVCAGSQVLYSVPNMEGSIYTWTVTGGTIIFMEGSHTIMVEWGNTNPASIQVNYTNQFLSCGGSANINITIKEEFSITGPEKICDDGILELEANNPLGISLTWTATNDIGTIFNLGTNAGTPTPFIVNWNYGSGNFIITATDNSNSYCNTISTINVEILEPPPAPDCPVGDLIVCPGTPHEYTGLPSSGDYYLNWEVVNGTPLTANGNAVTITWASTGGPYQILLSQVEATNGCISPACTLNVNAKQIIAPSLLIPPNTSLPDACINSIENYAILNGPLNAEQIIWSISPETAGSIVTGQNTENVTIQWNNTTGNAQIIIQTVVCGMIQAPVSTPISIIGNPSISINPASSTICENSSVLFSVPNSPPGSYSWTFGDGGTSSQSSPSHQYTTEGVYSVNLTINYFGCVSVASALVVVEPGPDAAIMASPGFICAQQGVTSSVLTVVQQGVGYLWSTGATTQNITVNTAGIAYTVTITDANQCTASASIMLAGCGPGSCPPAPSSPDFSWSPNPVQCGNDPIDFLQTVMIPNMTSFIWKFGDGTSDGTNQDPTHYYYSAGIYTVTLDVVNTNGECATVSHNVEVPLFAKFRMNYYCNNNGTNYETHFINMSTYTANLSNITWAWYANGSSTPFSTVENPVITNFAGTALLAGQSNTIELVISDGTHTCSVTKTIFLLAPPTGDFTISPALPGPYCEKQTVITFDATSNTGVLHALWDFGDNASSTLFPETERVYLASNHTVQLTVYDNFGCSYSSSDQVFIFQNNLGGKIVPNPLPSFCPGDNGQFFYQPNFNTDVPTGYLWSTGTTQYPLTVTQTGEYFVTVYESNSGCYYQVPAPGYASVFNVPQPVIRGKDFICEGEDLLLDGNQGSGQYTYIWDINPIPSMLIHPDPYTLSAPAIAAGYYTVTLYIIAIDSVTQTSCTLSTSKNIIVSAAPPPPDIQSNVAPPCEGQEHELTVTNHNGNWVNWSTGANGPVTYAYSAGIYGATLTDINGCTSSSEFNIYDQPYFDWLNTGCFELK